MNKLRFIINSKNKFYKRFEVARTHEFLLKKQNFHEQLMTTRSELRSKLTTNTSK